MPVTLAHPAAVLPLGRLGLPMAALVAGSMAPDLPVFLQSWGAYGVTHSAVGVVTVDVVVAMVALVAWSVVARDAVVDMAPDRARSRLEPWVRPTRREWLLAVPAACLGAATHVVWDAFTHPGRWGPRHVEWLHNDHAGLPGSKWLQYASGVVGLAVVAWAALRHLRSRAPRPGPRAPRVLPPATLPAAVAGAALVGLSSGAVHAPDLHDMAYFAVVHGLIALVVLCSVACAAWHGVRRRRVAGADR
ncbi:DUF4184 family protein [Nocardioides sp. TF02-7]|uniref:DUF4184 family protein n=1 Tax=Nocardioides sp. TF02-7 TaxID=2917724 RepID=UPI001F05599D|nr:DUF4184 family protein [Nocardioides sp. TF02-7]UMG93240.1 DUF4184 family protein [Nocardioides sp. TF02-7]